MPHRGSLVRVLLTAACLALPLRAVAQDGRSATPKVAVLDVALYNEGANLKEPSDTSRAALSSGVLRGKLAELLGDGMVDSVRVRKAAATDSAMAITGNKPCNVIVACARYAGRALGADYAVMAKVSKTSNLIWLFTGQLIDVRSGKILMDDSTELKGDPEPMVRAGTRIFAERVARTVKQGAISAR